MISLRPSRLRLAPCVWSAFLLFAVARAEAQSAPPPESVPPLAGNVAPTPDTPAPATPPAPGDTTPNVPAPNALKTPPAIANGAPDLYGAPGYASPERAAKRRAQMEARLRSLMTDMGFPDPDVQNAIVAHIAGEERALAPARQAARNLLSALRDMDAPPTRVVRLLLELRATLEAERLRRKEAQIVLDDKISYSKQPRLEALLTILGVLGDGPTFVPLRAAPDAATPPNNGGNGKQNGPQNNIQGNASQNSTYNTAPNTPVESQIAARGNVKTPAAPPQETQ